MAKIFNFYTKNENGVDVDRAWFQSSNIRYCECLDHNGQLKTLKVVFNNGTQYEYKNVNVNHYLLFREDVSQGKALNKFIKGNNYEYTKLENANLEELEGELSFRMEGGIFVNYDDGNFKILDNRDNMLCEKEVKLTKAAFDTICAALNVVGKLVSSDGKNFLEDGENTEDKPF